MATTKSSAKKTAAKKTAVKKANPVRSSKENLESSSAKNESNLKKRFSRKKVIIAILIIAALGLLYYFKGLFVAALVNGQPISRLQVVQELEKRGGQQTLSSLITEALIIQEAKNQGVEVTQEEVDEQIKTTEDSMKAQGQNLDDALSFQGLTREDFVDQIRIQLMVEKILADDIAVSDEEVNDYVENNSSLFPEDMTHEEATTTARQQLEQQKLTSRAQEWIAELQSNANIQYFVNY